METQPDPSTTASAPPTATASPLTVAVLCTDTRDRVLIVHPAHTGAPWTLPGGLVEAHEPPTAAVQREIREELGLNLRIQPDDLITIEWLAATRPGRRARLALVFAGPVLTDADTAKITLQTDEIDAWRLAPPAQALALLHPRMADRIRGPLTARGTAVYRETPHPPPERAR
jgi:8-oxo-dGTP pyrophosphatase MutT (NUDIX family)